MTRSPRTRRTALLAAGLVAGAVVTGCASDAGVEAAAATGTPPPSAETAAATSAPADLAAGLLPAEAWRRYAEDPVHLQVIAEHVTPILAARTAVQYEV